MNVLYTITGLFAATALAGIYLLTLVLQGKQTPTFVSMIHGGFALIALTMLVMYAVYNGPDPTESIVLFILAALGGLILVVAKLNGRPIPKWLAVGHGLIAVIGFVFLIVYACAD